MASQTSNAASSMPGPAWEIARLFPDQGAWTEGDYLDLTQDLNKLVELTHGRIDVLAMPDAQHQRVVAFAMLRLNEYVTQRKLGEVMFLPFRVRLGERVFREPDVTFMHRDHRDRKQEDFWEGADLMMEVVSPDPHSRERDYVTKRGDYERAGIPEYWIVDPPERRVTVLKLTVGVSAYAVHGEWIETGTVTSPTLPGFAFTVEDLLRAAAGESSEG